MASAVVWLAGNPAVLVWHSAGWMERPWALWTAAGVHLSTAHWLGNLLALAALALLGRALQAGAASALALGLAWPLTTLSLLLWPAVTSYGGLSGTLHAGMAVLALHCAWRGSVVWAAVLGGGLALKLAGEQAWQQPMVFDAHWGFNVVVAAHLGGAIAGLLCALAAQLWRSRLSARRPP